MYLRVYITVKSAKSRIGNGWNWKESEEKDKYVTCGGNEEFSLMVWRLKII